MLAKLIGKKIIIPLKAFFIQGLNSKELSLSIAFEMTLGTFPMLGVTMILCLLIGLNLKLN